jgi:hypothetical protein
MIDLDPNNANPITVTNIREAAAVLGCRYHWDTATLLENVLIAVQSFDGEVITDDSFLFVLETIGQEERIIPKG